MNLGLRISCSKAPSGYENRPYSHAADAVVSRSRNALRRMTAVGSLLVAMGLPALAAGQQIPFEEVVANLRHDDPGVRVSSMRLLRESGYPEAAGPIATLLYDRSERIRHEAIETLVDLFLAERVSNRRKVGRVIEVRDRSLIESAFKAGPAATMPQPVPDEVLIGLVAVLGDGRAKIRADATWALGTIFPASTAPSSGALAEKTIDAVIVGLKDQDPLVRSASAGVLGQLFHSCPAVRAHRRFSQLVSIAGTALIEAINDREDRVRIEAMRALGALRFEESVQALTDQFSYHKRRPLAVAAAEALAHIGHLSSMQMFRNLLLHREPVMRRIGVEGIGRSGDVKAGEQLIADGRAEGAASVALATAFALHRLGYGAQLTMIVEGMRKPSLRVQAEAYLIEIGPSVAAELQSFLHDPDPRMRHATADVLGQIGGSESLQALVPLLRDPDPRVAAAADRAIRRVQSRRG
jgi:HEAT repeat protein